MFHFTQSRIPFYKAVSHLRLLPWPAALPRLCQFTDPNGGQNPKGPQPREELARNPFPLARFKFPTPADLSPSQGKETTSPYQRVDPATQCEVSYQGDPSEDALHPRARLRPAPAGRPTLTSSPPPPRSLTGAPAPRAAAAPPHPASHPRPLPARRWRPAVPHYSSASGPTRRRCSTWR